MESLGDKPKPLQIKAKQCDAEKKFEKILGHVEKIRDDSKSDQMEERVKTTRQIAGASNMAGGG